MEVENTCLKQNVFQGPMPSTSNLVIRKFDPTTILRKAVAVSMEIWGHKTNMERNNVKHGVTQLSHKPIIPLSREFNC